MRLVFKHECSAQRRRTIELLESPLARLCEMAEERGLEIYLDCPNPKQMLVAALVGDEGEASTANPVAEEGGAGAGEDGVDGSAK